MYNVSIYSTDKNCQYILQYVYDNLDIKDALYLSSDRIPIDDYNYKGIKKILHLLSPSNGEYFIDNIKIVIKNLIINDKAVVVNLDDKEFMIVKEIVLSSVNKDDIKNFVDKCYYNRTSFLENIKLCSKNKLKKKIYTKYGWGFNTYIPKRDINTVFLKEGQIDKIKNKLLEFIDKNTYNDYIKHGVPYKLNILLHGSPGVGKTTLIHTMASLCSANICVININSELKEPDLIDAFRCINDEDGLCFIIIEDIDCIFEDRKVNDTMRNNITMQGLLNCMDGFNNQEGLIIIMTTNYPEKLDPALKRSGRIDMSIELTNIDKYQANNMYSSFFKNDEFDIFWNNIKKYSVPPCSLLEFFFNNRKETSIINKIDDLIKLLDKKNLTMYN